MDLKTVGRYISTKRKDKNYTQEKLGELLGGVSGKTISKWERGINAPDISLLKDLSRELDVSVLEILNGYDDVNDGNNDDINDDNNDCVIDGIKYYTSTTKKRYIRIIFDLVIIVVLFFSCLFFINNYNRVKIYKINSKNNNYFVQGYIMYNQQKNVFIIKNIDLNCSDVGTNEEERASQIKFSISSGKKIIFSEFEEFDQPVPFFTYLINKSYFYDERVNAEEEIFTKNFNINNLQVNIEYINTNDEKKIISIPLYTIKEFSNNKLMY